MTVRDCSSRPVADLVTRRNRPPPSQVSGLFFAIGHEPASKFLSGQVLRS